MTSLRVIWNHSTSWSVTVSDLRYYKLVVAFSFSIVSVTVVHNGKIFQHVIQILTTRIGTFSRTQNFGVTLFTSKKRCATRKLLCSDTLSLQGRRYRGFHTYRHLFLYLRKLAKRVVMPKSPPSEDDIDGILDLEISVATALSFTVFLNRLKIESKLDHACKLKAEVEKHETKGENLSI